MANIITSLEEAVLAIRACLPQYLNKTLGVSGNKAFKCPFHDDTGRPNMVLNKKTENQTAHCFACGETADIFKFASKLEDLPSSGAEWVTITVATLAKALDIPVQLGEPTEAQKQRSQMMRLLHDIADIMDHLEVDEYQKTRGWTNENITMGSIDHEMLIDRLVGNGWDREYVESTHTICWRGRDKKDQPRLYRLFGNDLFTSVIRDVYKRPIGFIARWKNYDSEVHDEKYIHSLNNIVFDKPKVLFGIHTDINKCRQSGVYLVESTGNVCALNSKGITNCAAVLGTAITESHLLELKKLGIRKVIACLDWDKAGQNATARVVDSVFPKVHELSYLVKSGPEGYDVDDYLKTSTAEDFLALSEETVFEFKLKRMPQGTPAEEVCSQMVPMIATEVSAIKRSLLTKILSDYTMVQFAAIESDVETVRNYDVNTKNSSIKAAAQELMIAIEKAPTDYMALRAQFDDEVERIEKKYSRASLGVNYQLQRYEDMQKLRDESDADNNNAMFTWKYFSELNQKMTGGMAMTRSCLCYVGGRANSGKTLSTLAIASDTALHDNNAMAIIHSIDDSYEQVEPRLKTNLFNMYYWGQEDVLLTLDMVERPWEYRDNKYKDMLRRADNLFKELLGEEKLVILDAEDGANLTALEKNYKYYRTKYPARKFFGVCDNTHDYQDFLGLDQMTRMKMISSRQKELVNKYKMCMFATAEYRKAPPGSNERMILPTNDDLADSRAMSYKPNLIFHVYNDLADRGEKAELFWEDDRGNRYPRLLWVVTKNKMNSFKGKLVNDVYPGPVMIIPKNTDQLKNEWDMKQRNPNYQREIDEFDSDLGYEVTTDYEG